MSATTYETAETTQLPKGSTIMKTMEAPSVTGPTFTASAFEVKQSLATLKPAIPPRGHLPALGCVLVTVEPNTVTLSATSLDLTVTRRLQTADTGTTGRVLVPFATFAKFVAKATAKDRERLAIAQTANDIATLRLGKLRLDAGTGPLDEYPRQNDTAPDFTTVLPTSPLVDVIDSVLTGEPPTPKCEPLVGVWLADEIATTDRYRLTVVRGAADLSECPMLVPASAIREVLKLKVPEVAVSKVGRDVVFVSDDTTIRARLTEGEYPNYKGLIPTTMPNGAVFDDVPDVIRGLTDLFGFIENAEAVRVTPTDTGGIELVVTNDKGTMTRDVAGSWHGTPSRLSYNAGYLRDLFTGLPTTTTTLFYLDALKPAVVFADRPDGGRLVKLLMPIR